MRPLHHAGHRTRCPNPGPSRSERRWFGAAGAPHSSPLPLSWAIILVSIWAIALEREWSHWWFCQWRAYLSCCRAIVFWILAVLDAIWEMAKVANTVAASPRKRCEWFTTIAFGRQKLARGVRWPSNLLYKFWYEIGMDFFWIEQQSPKSFYL